MVLKLEPFNPEPVAQVLTVVHRQDFTAVHLDEGAQRELRVFDAQLFGPLKRDALQRKIHINTNYSLQT